ncbi:hypothetical protein GQR58_011254 [Nymphon striatum]|nr:hypothetical protein GQR58_011254 [Nymphon striatum]
MKNYFVATLSHRVFHVATTSMPRCHYVYVTLQLRVCHVVTTCIPYCQHISTNHVTKRESLLRIAGRTFQRLYTLRLTRIESVHLHHSFKIWCAILHHRYQRCIKEEFEVEKELDKGLPHTSLGQVEELSTGDREDHYLSEADTCVYNERNLIRYMATLNISLQVPHNEQENRIDRKCAVMGPTSIEKTTQTSENHSRTEIGESISAANIAIVDPPPPSIVIEEIPSVSVSDVDSCLSYSDNSSVWLLPDQLDGNTWKQLRQRPSYRKHDSLLSDMSLEDEQKKLGITSLKENNFKIRATFGMETEIGLNSYSFVNMARWVFRRWKQRHLRPPEEISGEEPLEGRKNLQRPETERSGSKQINKALSLRFSRIKKRKKADKGNMNLHLIPPQPTSRCPAVSSLRTSAVMDFPDLMISEVSRQWIFLGYLPVDSPRYFLKLALDIQSHECNANIIMLSVKEVSAPGLTLVYTLFGFNTQRKFVSFSEDKLMKLVDSISMQIERKIKTGGVTCFLKGLVSRNLGNPSRRDYAHSKAPSHPRHSKLQQHLANWCSGAQVASPIRCGEHYVNILNEPQMTQLINFEDGASQGEPIPPLIFNLCADLILRHLHLEFQGSGMQVDSLQYSRVSSSSAINQTVPAKAIAQIVGSNDHRIIFDGARDCSVNEVDDAEETDAFDEASTDRGPILPINNPNDKKKAKTHSFCNSITLLKNFNSIISIAIIITSGRIGMCNTIELVVLGMGVGKVLLIVVTWSPPPPPPTLYQFCLDWTEMKNAKPTTFTDLSCWSNCTYIELLFSQSLFNYVDIQAGTAFLLSDISFQKDTTMFSLHDNRWQQRIDSKILWRHKAVFISANIFNVLTGNNNLPHIFDVTILEFKFLNKEKVILKYNAVLPRFEGGLEEAIKKPMEVMQNVAESYGRSISVHRLSAIYRGIKTRRRFNFADAVYT